MNTEQQEAYAADIERRATECGEELAKQVSNAPVANMSKATKAAIKLAFIRGAQWAMRDALATVIR